MLILNTTKNNIGPFTFAGYEFIVPPGVSCVWDDVGEDLLKRYKIEETPIQDPITGKVRHTGSTVPVVMRAAKKDWKGQYAVVSRFHVNPELLANTEKVLELAEERGVDPKIIDKFKKTKNLNKADITQAINELPVPDNIRLPEEFENIDEK